MRETQTEVLLLAVGAEPADGAGAVARGGVALRSVEARAGLTAVRSEEAHSAPPTALRPPATAHQSQQFLPLVCDERLRFSVASRSKMLKEET